MSEAKSTQSGFWNYFFSKTNYGIYVITGLLIITALWVLYAVLNQNQQSYDLEIAKISDEKDVSLVHLYNLSRQSNQIIHSALFYESTGKETSRLEAIALHTSVVEGLKQLKTQLESQYENPAIQNSLSNLENNINDLLKLSTGFYENFQITINDADIEIQDEIDQDANNSIQSIISLNRIIQDQFFDLANQVIVQAGYQMEGQTKNKLALPFSLLALALMTIIAIGAMILDRRMKTAVGDIRDTLMTIAKGSQPDLSEKKLQGFLPIVEASNELVNYLQEAGMFAKKIGEGEYNHSFSPKSDKDVLGNSLLEMKDRLQEVAREDKIRNWTNEGQAKFGELLRQHSGNLAYLGGEVITNLVEYLNASLGALFVLNEHGDQQHLEMLASYAYKRKRHVEKRIEIGEGLAGQVFEEGKKVFIKDIRTDHYNIVTGTGESRPSCLLIVPLKEEERVEGVIEIASLNMLQDYEIAFVESIAKSIASSLNAGKINEKTRRLLEETQEKAEQMKAQEEELRQNMEELAATQEQIERRNRELESVQNELAQERLLLNALLSHSTDHIYFKDKDSKFIRVSQSMVRLFNTRDVSEIIGKSDFDFGFGEHAKVAFEDEQRIIRTGKPMEDAIEKETWDDGRISWVSTTKSPLRDLEGKIIGTFGISRDVTTNKKAEIALLKQKAWFENFFRFNPTAFTVTDQHGEVVFISQSLLAAANASTDEKLTFEDIFDAMKFSEFLDAISFKHKKDQALEIKLTIRNSIKGAADYVVVSGSTENEDGSMNIYIIQK